MDAGIFKLVHHDKVIVLLKTVWKPSRLGPGGKWTKYGCINICMCMLLSCYFVTNLTFQKLVILCCFKAKYPYQNDRRDHGIISWFRYKTYFIIVKTSRIRRFWWKLAFLFYRIINSFYKAKLGWVPRCSLAGAFFSRNNTSLDWVNPHGVNPV